MRRNIVGLLAVALICVCGVARPSIVYTVNITDGSETVSGTITTDGTIGVLAAGDIIAWDLTALGPQTFGPATGTGVVCGSVGCGLDATPNSLLLAGSNLCIFPCPFVEFDDGDTSLTFFFDIFGASILVIGPEAQTCGPDCAGGYILRTIGPIGSATVPEPGTVTLLGLALAGLGFARKRSRERQATAV